MSKKTKWFISLLLSMVMLMGCFPMVGFAAETDTVGAQFRVTAAPAVEMPDNEELFAYFVQRELYGYGTDFYGTAAREKLNATEQAIYDVLKTKVEAVAVEGGSSVFAVPGISGLKTAWTNEELDVPSIEDMDAVGEAFEAQFVLGDIMAALLHD